LNGFRFLSFDDGDIDYDHRLLKVAREIRLASGAGVRSSVAKLTQLLGEESAEDVGRLGSAARSRTGQRSVSYTGGCARGVKGVSSGSALEGDAGTFDERKVAESQSVDGMRCVREGSFVTENEHRNGADEIGRAETEGNEKDSGSEGGRKTLGTDVVSFWKPQAPRNKEPKRMEPVFKETEIGLEKEDETSGEEEALEHGAQRGNVNRGRSVEESAVERHVAGSERPSEKADGVLVPPDESNGTSSESSDHFLGLQELILKHPLRARERSVSAPAPKTYNPEVAPVDQRRASLSSAKLPLPKAEQIKTGLRKEAELQRGGFMANSDRSRTGTIAETGSLGQQAQRRQDPSQSVVKAAWSNGEPRLRTEPFRDNHSFSVSAQPKFQSKASEHKGGSRPPQVTELELRIVKKAVDVRKPISLRKTVNDPKKRQSRGETDGPSVRRTSLPLLSAQEWRDDRSAYVEKLNTSSQKA
jgi:hypothetical protein